MKEESLQGGKEREAEEKKKKKRDMNVRQTGKI